MPSQYIMNNQVTHTTGHWQIIRFALCNFTLNSRVTHGRSSLFLFFFYFWFLLPSSLHLPLLFSFIVTGPILCNFFALSLSFSLLVSATHFVVWFTLDGSFIKSRFGPAVEDRQVKKKNGIQERKEGLRCLVSPHLSFLLLRLLLSFSSLLSFFLGLVLRTFLLLLSLSLWMKVYFITSNNIHPAYFWMLDMHCVIFSLPVYVCVCTWLANRVTDQRLKVFHSLLAARKGITSGSTFNPSRRWG